MVLGRGGSRARTEAREKTFKAMMAEKEALMQEWEGAMGWGKVSWRPALYGVGLLGLDW